MREAGYSIDERIATPNSESAGNEAWQRTKYLLAQMHERRN